MQRYLATLREAEALAEALDDPRRLGQVAIFQAFHFNLIGAHDQAIAAASRALAVAKTGGDVVQQALAHWYLGFSYNAQGDYRRAIDCLGQTVACLDGARRYEHFGLPNLPAVIARA
jgi:tetratricopeptide (TPR) repeat protein